MGDSTDTNRLTAQAVSEDLNTLYEDLKILQIYGNKRPLSDEPPDEDSSKGANSNPVQAYDYSKRHVPSWPHPFRQHLPPTARREPKPNLAALGSCFNILLLLGVIQGASPSLLFQLAGFCTCWAASKFLTQHVAKNQEDGTAIFVIFLGLFFLLWLTFSAAIHAFIMAM